MSTAAGARLVQMTSVSRLLILMAVGMSRASWEALPSLKVGNGASWTPAKVVDGTPRRANATVRRNAIIRDFALRSGGRNEREAGNRRRRIVAGRVGITDQMEPVDQDRRARDVLRGRDDSSGPVLEVVRRVAYPEVEGDRGILVEHTGVPRGDRLRLARADVEDGPVTR